MMKPVHARQRSEPNPPYPISATLSFPTLSNPAICVVQEIELADKTVRAKDNNEKLHAALQAKARQAERMTVMNQGLAFENRSLRNDVDLAKASEVRGSRERKGAGRRGK